MDYVCPEKEPECCAKELPQMFFPIRFLIFHYVRLRSSAVLKKKRSRINVLDIIEFSLSLLIYYMHQEMKNDSWLNVNHIFFLKIVY